MKVKSWILVLLALLLAGPRVLAQSLSMDSEKKARELLRETVTQREVPKPAPIYTSHPAPVPAAPQPSNLSPTGKSSRPVDYAEVEQAYLSGKISARQFQRYLENGQQVPAPIINSQSAATMVRRETPQASAPLIMKGGQGTETVVTRPEPAVSVKTEVKPEEPAASPINEVEKKMDELLRLKAAREQAAMASAAALSNTNNLEKAASKTKRERLDNLLKLYIGGKISEPEYKAKRDKLIGEGN